MPPHEIRIYIYSAFFIAMTNALLKLGCEALLKFNHISMPYLTTFTITHTKLRRKLGLYMKRELESRCKKAIWLALG